MAIKLNNQLITSLKLNNQDVTEVKLNNIRVYPLEPQIYVEFDFPWNSQTNRYEEFGYPAPVSQGDNYNRVNLIGGPGLKESKLNDLLFNVFGTGPKEKVSGNFTNFNVWYEAIFPVESTVFAKAEVRFGENYMDLRRGQFSENNMASWYNFTWDFNGIGIPITKEWVYLFNSTSSSEYVTGRVGNLISIMGYFGGDIADMQDYITDNYPPDNYDVGRVLVVYDYDTGYYYYFQVGQE